ncbi:phage antirepressor N-terminal domain-containing protein [Moraxella sp. VT-16-12]|uniref:phage antirepressor N-terminal domain-containing protein n=1 Tax=Moraxella sp. VT-16-12 TaxID=2014877 RepID=UPI0021036CEA|nr:phage antirepressor N-terminal domain-containing protein [Moraxella sp. VT-16-12]
MQKSLASRRKVGKALFRFNHFVRKIYETQCNSTTNREFSQSNPAYSTKRRYRLCGDKPICENIGLDWDSQRKRIERDEVLNSVKVMMTATGSDSKPNYTKCSAYQSTTLTVGSLV